VGYFIICLLQFTAKSVGERNVKIGPHLAEVIGKNIVSPLFLDTGVKKGNLGFPYSLPSVGPGADPGVQAVSP